MPNSFLLNIDEHENFSANKYENANYFQIFSYLITEKISSSAELSMKELLPRGLDSYFGGWVSYISEEFSKITLWGS